MKWSYVLCPNLSVSDLGITAVVLRVRRRVQVRRSIRCHWNARGHFVVDARKMKVQSRTFCTRISPDLDLRSYL